MQATANKIRLTHIGRHGIELRRGHRVDEIEGLALIVTHVQSAVVADDNVLAVFRVNPDRVMIAVGYARQVFEGLAAVGRTRKIQSAGENDFGVGRINAHLAVIHRAIVIVADDAPGLAFIIRPPQA